MKVGKCHQRALPEERFVFDELTEAVKTMRLAATELMESAANHPKESAARESMWHQFVELELEDNVPEKFAVLQSYKQKWNLSLCDRTNLFIALSLAMIKTNEMR